jgi:hypothetical protein
LISATNNDYLGGGSPNGGVPAGDSVTFTLTLLDLNGNTAESIFSSELVRFRGFNDGGEDSDKDPEVLTAIPEPASMLLLGSGLVAVGAGIRLRRRALK